MSFDLQKVLESKRVLRRTLAAKPVVEKLRLLDALRERAVAIRDGALRLDSGAVRDKPSAYLKRPQ